MPQFENPPPEEFSQPSHTVVLGKKGVRPADKVETPIDVPPSTADRSVTAWFMNATGLDLTLLRSDCTKGSVWAKEPAKTIPLGNAGHFQVDSNGAGHDASAYALYKFDTGVTGRPPAYIFFCYNPWTGPNYYYSQISDGYAIKQTGGGGAQATVWLMCTAVSRKQGDEA